VIEMSQTAETAPTSPDWRVVAEYVCRLGATDTDLAEVFGVTVATVAGWMADIPDFAHAVSAGRDLADGIVAESLYRLGVGYSHPEDRVLVRRGVPLKVTVTRHYPPHGKSCITWLENRRPHQWSRNAPEKRARTVAEIFDTFSQAFVLPREASGENESALGEGAQPLLVGSAGGADDILPAAPGKDLTGAGAHVAGAAAEGRPEEAAEVRLAGEAQAEGDLVDAAVLLRGIGQGGMGADEALFLDVAATPPSGSNSR
jgi:hypothetical protein